MQILKVTLLVLLLSSVAAAHNTYFLPGDAFFFSRLSLEDLQKLQNSDSPVLSCSLPFTGAAACGYIGYEKIELGDMDAKTKAALINSYRQFEKQIKAELEAQEKGSGDFRSDDEPVPEISVFIYSAGYDWKRYGISIQYNENWLEESIAFGTKHDHTLLNTFSSATVTNNWRDAKLVEPLGAQCPELPDGRPADVPTSWGETR